MRSSLHHLSNCLHVPVFLQNQLIINTTITVNIGGPCDSSRSIWIYKLVATVHQKYARYWKAADNPVSHTSCMPYTKHHSSFMWHIQNYIFYYMNTVHHFHPFSSWDDSPVEFKRLTFSINLCYSIALHMDKFSVSLVLSIMVQFLRCKNISDGKMITELF